MDTHEGLRCVTSCVAARSDILTYMQALCKRLRLFTGRTDVDEAEEVEGIQMFSSQSTLSRRFRDPELETAYREDNFKVRGKALRVLNMILAIFYMLIILDAALKWGSLNVDPNLVQYNLLQYYIPLGLCLLLTGVMYSHYYTSSRFALFFFTNYFLLMVFHTAPTLLEAWSTGTLAAAAANTTTTNSGDSAVVELAQLAAWFMSKSVSYLLAIMIVCPDLPSGVGTFCAIFPLYYLKARVEWLVFYSFDISSLTPNLVLCTLFSFGFILMADSVRRRQFVLVTLLRRSTSARIEQLAREKERLDYERLFAERALMHERSASSRADTPHQLQAASFVVAHGDDRRYDEPDDGPKDGRVHGPPPGSGDAVADYHHHHNNNNNPRDDGRTDRGLINGVGLVTQTSQFDLLSSSAPRESSYGTCSELGACNGMHSSAASSHSDGPPIRLAPAAATTASAAATTASAAATTASAGEGKTRRVQIHSTHGESMGSIAPWSHRPLWRRIHGRQESQLADADGLSSVAGSSVADSVSSDGHVTPPPAVLTCASRDEALARTLNALNVVVSK